MTDFKQQYKNPRPGFGDPDHRRYLRAFNYDKSRKEVRAQTFDRNRNLQGVSVPSSPQDVEATSTINDERMKKLLRWKEERNRKKKLEATLKKPAFKVGIVHHSLCSPIIKSRVSAVTEKPAKKMEQSNFIKKRVTRATEKRLLAKAAADKQLVQHPPSVSIKHLISAKTPTSNIKKQKSFAPLNYCFKPPSGMQSIPLFGFVPMKNTPQEKYTPSQKNTQASENLKTSTHQRSSSNKQNSSKKLNKMIRLDSDKLNTSKTVRSSLKGQAKNQIDMPDSDQKEDYSSSSSDTETSREKYIPSQKNTQTSENLKTSTDQRSQSNKQNSSKKLKETINLDSDESNISKTVRSSFKEQAKDQMDMQDSSPEEHFSLNSIDTKMTPKFNSMTYEKENCATEDLIIFSPYLTRSRGKRNSRIEIQQRLGIGRRSSEIPTKDTVMENLNICVEEEERTAQYFKFLLNKETDRLKELCNKWLNIGLGKDIPEDAVYEIQQAVGQTNLLINKKFERFHGLVRDCETGKGEMLVTCRDLQGFWDMTYMEVRDCDIRFEKLEQRRNRQWQEEEYPVVQPAIKKRMPVKKQIVSSKPSSLRSLILAARKNKMEPGALNKEAFSPQVKQSNKKSFTALEENTDSRRSARRSKSLDLNRSKSTPTLREGSRVNSVQKVQFPDKFKIMRSPFAAMKISQKCKTPEVQLDDTISYVNSDQTPGKSILKKSEELEDKEARIKSAHKVNFDDHVVLTEVPLDKEVRTKLNLAAALDISDNFDLYGIKSPHINAEKRLDFKDEDSDNSDTLNGSGFKVKPMKKLKEHKSLGNILDASHPLIDITSSVPTELSLNNVEIISPRKKSRNRAKRTSRSTTTEIIAQDMENLDLGIKVLRNRSISTNNTPKSSRTSKMMTPKRSNVSNGENKSPVKLNRKNSLKLPRKTPSKSSVTEIENVTLIDKIAEKRSFRKSVAFDETCVACNENKPVLPMTPYSSRRSKTSSRQSQSKHTLDVMSSDRKQRRRRTIKSHSDNS